jgi:hypothetical protein
MAGNQKISNSKSFIDQQWATISFKTLMAFFCLAINKKNPELF